MFFVERMQLLNRTLKVFDEVFSTYVQQYIGLRNVILFQCASVDVPATQLTSFFCTVIGYSLEFPLILNCMYMTGVGIGTDVYIKWNA